MFELMLKKDNDIQICYFNPLKSEFIFKNEKLNLYNFINITQEDINKIKQEPKKEIQPVFEGCEVGKSNYIHTLRIQLGLKCNYSCLYCSQETSRNVHMDNKDDIDEFVDNMNLWLFKEPFQIEFWGGEPFVYWKKLKPLVEKIRKKYPNTYLKLFTNGTLFDEEKITWLKENDIRIGISHDGPGQFLRGDDPFDNKKQSEMLKYIFNNFDKSHVWLHSVLTTKNYSLSDLNKFFTEKLNTDNFAFTIEGFVTVHNNEGFNLSPHNKEEYLTIAKEFYLDCLKPEVFRHSAVTSFLVQFIRTIIKETEKKEMGQRCGFDRENFLTVDLNGNVLVCQNQNSEMEKLGSVYDFANIKMKHSTSWHDRDECNNCPSLLTCYGECMLIENDLRRQSCDNKFYFGLAKLAVFLYAATNYELIAVNTNNYIRFNNIKRIDF